MMQQPLNSQNLSGSPLTTPEIDVLHAQHPAVLNAISVLTRGSDKPGYAFRQSEDFQITKPGGKQIGGKAGDYILVFKVPERIEINSQLIDEVKKSGIPNKDHWISVIDGAILNFSYSTAPESDNVIGSQGLSYNECHPVFKAMGLKQKALIPEANQTKLISIESAQAGTTQNVDDNELVLVDIEGNPYPKWASQFVTQFKPDPEDPRSEKLFEEVRLKYKL